MWPGVGSCRSMRHRKSCASSSSVGLPKLAYLMPCGLHAPTTCLTMPPLPAVSIPCNTSRILRLSPARLAAYSISWSSANRSLRSSCRSGASDLEPLNPGVALVSISATDWPGVNSRWMCGSCVHREGRSDSLIRSVKQLRRQNRRRMRALPELLQGSADLDDAAQRAPGQHRQVVDQLV